MSKREKSQKNTMLSYVRTILAREGIGQNGIFIKFLISHGFAKVINK